MECSLLVADLQYKNLGVQEWLGVGKGFPRSKLHSLTVLAESELHLQNLGTEFLFYVERKPVDCTLSNLASSKAG